MTTTTTDNGSGPMVPAPRTSIMFGSKGLELRSFEDVQRFAKTAALSGFFPGARGESLEVLVAQACIKIQWGGELGIRPITALQNIHFIEGKMSLSAGLIAALVLSSGERAAYKVKSWTREGCTLSWTIDGEHSGESSFTWEDARLAGVTGKKNWSAYPKAMLFARALTQGARAFAPHVFMGPIYCPEELGSEGNEDVIDFDSDGTPKGVGVEATPRTAQVKSGSDALKKAAAKAIEAATVDADVVPTETKVVVDADAQRSPPDEPEAEAAETPTEAATTTSPHVVVAGEETAPGATETVLGAALMRAILDTPSDGNQSVMVGFLAGWKGKLSDSDHDTLKVWARATYHRARGVDENSGLNVEQRATVAAIKQLLGSQAKA